MNAHIDVVTTSGVKPFNEDRACMRSTILSGGALSSRVALPVMLAVFDGVSFGGQGSVAAQVVAEVFSEMVGSRTGSVPSVEALQNAGAEAQRKLEQLKRSFVIDHTAACTASGLVMERDGSLVLFNVGDSGVFRMRGQILVKLTKDHTIANSLRDHGASDELVAEAMQSDAHVITRAFGMDGAPTPILDIKPSKYVPGDCFVVCSDGLSDVVEADQMVRILTEEAAGHPAKALAKHALAAGATDNITAIVVRVLD